MERVVSCLVVVMHLMALSYIQWIKFYLFNQVCLVFVWDCHLCTLYSGFNAIGCSLIPGQVPVRVAGGLLFELLGQSAGDPFVEEDDIPIVLRSWLAQNFLVTALHVKGSASNINVLGIAEVQVRSCPNKSLLMVIFVRAVGYNSVSILYKTIIEFCLMFPCFVIEFCLMILMWCLAQELLAAGRTNIPRTAHEIIAHLACCLARWDDR